MEANVKLLVLCLFSFTAAAVEEGDITLETYAFGISYHSNRTVPWNERNWGGGLGLTYSFESADVILSSGTYIDSYDERAKFILLGSRGILGWRDKQHATIGWSAGFYRGSGFGDFGILPVLSAGYGPVDLCFTGSFHTGRDRDAPDGDPHKVSTSYFCLFLKLRVWTF